MIVIINVQNKTFLVQAAWQFLILKFCWPLSSVMGKLPAIRMCVGGHDEKGSQANNLGAFDSESLHPN